MFRISTWPSFVLLCTVFGVEILYLCWCTVPKFGHVFNWLNTCWSIIIHCRIEIIVLFNDFKLYLQFGVSDVLLHFAGVARVGKGSWEKKQGYNWAQKEDPFSQGRRSTSTSSSSSLSITVDKQYVNARWLDSNTAWDWANIVPDIFTGCPKHFTFGSDSLNCCQGWLFVDVAHH